MGLVCQCCGGGTIVARFTPGMGGVMAESGECYLWPNWGEVWIKRLNCVVRNVIVWGNNKCYECTPYYRGTRCLVHSINGATQLNWSTNAWLRMVRHFMVRKPSHPGGRRHFDECNSKYDLIHDSAVVGKIVG